jgi:plastocyanin
MRRSLVITLVAGLSVAATAVGGVATASAARTTPTMTVTITSSGCPGGKIFCFKPATLIVASPTKVVWKNTSGAPHTVSRCDVAHCGVSGGTGTDPHLQSKTISPGHTFTFTFQHVGTYVYYCQVHGYAIMHGTITVRTKVGGSPTTTTMITGSSTTTTSTMMPYPY